MFSIPHSLQNCWATLCHFLHYCGFMKMLAASLPMVVLASLITESVLARLGPLIAISNSSLTDSSFKFLFKWQWSSYLLTNKWLNNACTTNFYCNTFSTYGKWRPGLAMGSNYNNTINTLMATTFPVKQYIWVWHYWSVPWWSVEGKIPEFTFCLWMGYRAHFFFFFFFIPWKLFFLDWRIIGT